MEKSFEYRIYPNARQRELLGRTFGCCRYVWNRVLAARKDEYARLGRCRGIYEYMAELPAWKRSDAPWLAEVDSMALQQALRDLDRAYRNFFRNPGKTGFPKFKSKRAGRMSYRTNRAKVEDERHIRLPKLGRVRARVSRPPEGRILSATVKRVPSGKYFCVLCCTGCSAPAAPELTRGVLGVDAGVYAIATCSDGTILENPHALARSERRLAREQRRLSRKKKGSNRRSKQRVRVARVHEKIANQRKDAIHKFTTAAARESQAVAVEDLNVEGMKRNRHLAKIMSDASMSELARQLAYKCAWYGRAFVKVGRFYPSSKTCSACGQVNHDLTLSDRRWTCSACGAVHDRDLNAAVNIAHEGARLLAEGDGTAGLAGTPA